MTSFREHEKDETSTASPAQFGVLVGLENKHKTYARLWVFFLSHLWVSFVRTCEKKTDGLG